MSFEEFRRAKLFLLIVTFYSVSVQLVNYSIFHPILPFYLRKIFSRDASLCVYNVSEVDPCSEEDTDIEAEVSRTIGIVTGTGSAMQLLASIFSGLLLQKYTLRTNLLISVVLNLASPGLAFFSNNVVMICFANAAISAGSLLTFVTYYSMLSERSEDDKERMRLVTLYNVFNGLGNVIGYSAASASYQFLGHRITFAILFCLLAVDLVLRSLLKCPSNEPNLDVNSEEKIGEKAPQEMTRSQLLLELGTAPTIDDEEKDEALNEWAKYIVDPYVVLANLITFFLLVSICTLCTTGPFFVSSYLQAEQWQTGLNMGVGSCVELIMLSASAALVTTHRRRCLTILLCCLLSAAGFVWYPFANSVWEVMVPETFIRVSKAVGIVFVGTLYPYITDCREVGDCKMGYAIHGVFLSVGATLGSFGAGLIVVYATFQWLYVAVGTSMLVMALTVLPFFKLKPQEEDIRHSRISLASFQSRMSTVSRSRSEMNYVYRARSRGLGHTLAASMTDMTMSRLSIGRSIY